MSEQRDSHNIITITNHSALRTLELWLTPRRYNEVFPFLEDRRGRRMIGLNWKHSDGTYDKCGLVVVANLDVLTEAVEVCDKGRSHEK